MKPTINEPRMTKQFEAVAFYRKEGEQLGFTGKNLDEYARDKYREWMRKHEEREHGTHQS